MRPNWDDYFMGIVAEVAKRCTCARTPKGAVLVKGHRIIATGYIGSVAGQPHCDEAGHQMVDGHCVRTIHAETNAIAQAAKHGIATEGATCYTTVLPCSTCLKLLINAGIIRVVYKDRYLPQIGDPLATSHAELSRLSLECATDLEIQGLFKLEKWGFEINQLLSCRIQAQQFLKENPEANPTVRMVWQRRFNYWTEELSKLGYFDLEKEQGRKQSEIDYLLSLRAQAQQFLKETPESDLISRMSWQGQFDKWTQKLLGLGWDSRLGEGSGSVVKTEEEAGE